MYVSQPFSLVFTLLHRSFFSGNPSIDPSILPTRPNNSQILLYIAIKTGVITPSNATTTPAIASTSAAVTKTDPSHHSASLPLPCSSRYRQSVLGGSSMTARASSPGVPTIGLREIALRRPAPEPPRFPCVLSRRTCGMPFYQHTLCAAIAQVQWVRLFCDDHEKEDGVVLIYGSEVATYTHARR